MHLLYARFWHKFICDHYQIADTPENRRHADHSIREPFKELIVQGLVKGKAHRLQSGKYISSEEAKEYSPEEVHVSYEKMSKSKGTGVSPADMADKYGADTLRMAIMFGAPPEKDLNFDEKSLQNMKQYLDKI